MKSNESKIQLTKNIVKDITALVKSAVEDSYGVDVIESDSKKKGTGENVIINVHNNQTFDVEVHVSVAYSVKITGAKFECQKLVKYRLDRKYPKLCNKVNLLAMKISSK